MKKSALVLLAAPLALAACGGGSSGSALKIDPVAYVKHAAHNTAEMPSEHMTLNMAVLVEGQKITVQGSGDYTNRPLRGTLNVSMSVFGRDMKFNAVEDGTTIYMHSPLMTPLPSGRSWVKIDLQKAVSSKSGIDYSSLMSQSPASALQQLEAAGSVKSLGTETIDGVDTTHYQVTNLDFSKLPQGAKVDALAHPKFGPIDAWIGTNDGYVYRESLSVAYSVAGRSASMTMRVDLSKFGEDVNVSIPPASDVLDATSFSSAGFA